MKWGKTCNIVFEQEEDKIGPTANVDLFWLDAFGH